MARAGSAGTVLRRDIPSRIFNVAPELARIPPVDQDKAAERTRKVRPRCRIGIGLRRDAREVSKRRRHVIPSSDRLLPFYPLGLG